MTLTSEEVAWDVGGISVRGTLTRPIGTAPHPGIVFVAGSGPTDRDWCSPLLPGTNCSGRLVAEALTREGFMTLRYDKRASGPHAQENARRLVGRISMQSHLDELVGAVDTLRSDGDLTRLQEVLDDRLERLIHDLSRQAFPQRPAAVFAAVPPDEVFDRFYCIECGRVGGAGAC